MRKFPRRVENYTNAFFATCALILFMAFFTLAAVKGLAWVLLSAGLIESLIRLYEARMRNLSGKR